MYPNLFTETAKGKLIRPIWQLVLILVVINIAGTFGAGFFLGLPLGFYLGATGQGWPPSADLVTLIQLFSTSGVYALLFYWVRRREERPISSLGFFKGRAVKEVGLGWLIGAGFFTGILAILALLGMVEVTRLNLSISNLAVFLVFVIGWQLQSGAEEVLTRGWLLPVIATNHGKLLAVAVSSGLFGLLHLLNPNTSLLSTVNITLVGTFMCLYVLWKGDIWGVCAIHAAWNCFQGSVFGSSVSGMDTLDSALIHLKFTGNSLLTGGAFGIEASILVTLLFSLLCFLLWQKVRKDLVAA